MKNKGFTLIELLAVIVILAIIALIATPIIINIIGDAEDSSSDSSIEMYKSAVELAFSRHQMNNPTLSISNGDYSSNWNGTRLELNDTVINIEYSGQEIKCDINYNNGKVTFDNCIKVVSPTTICTPVTSTTIGNVPTGQYQAGDKYTCFVNDTTSYNFYILNTEGNNVNMIMDSNIVEEDVDWGEVNATYGPTAALQSLHNNTSSWTNIPNINLNYTDEGENYTGITTTGNSTVVKSSTGSTTSTLTNLKARLPKKSEISDYSSSANNEYLYDNMYAFSRIIGTSHEDNTANGLEFNLNTLGNAHGYWTLSSGDYNRATSVRFGGWILESDGITVSTSDGFTTGIRPVITLSKTMLG